MGAVFFMGFMAVIFFIAIFFIFVSVIWIILWNLRKRKGKSPKKRWIVIPIILLSINIVVASLPFVFFAFLRMANSANQRPVVYAQSGIMLYWPIESGFTESWFEMDGKRYTEFRAIGSREPFYVDYDKSLLGAPVANIKFDPSTSRAFNDFMHVLLSGKTYADQNISTIYPIANDNNFELFYVGDDPGGISMAGHTYYLGKPDGLDDYIDAIKQYYNNNDNYDTQNTISKNTVYASSEGWDEKRGKPRTEIKKSISLKADTFFEIYALYYSTQDPLRIEVPQKYSDIAAAAVPGTPYHGYESRDLYVYSIDKIVYIHVQLILIDEQAYIFTGTGEGKISVRPLPDEMNDYIVETVFND